MKISLDQHKKRAALLLSAILKSEGKMVKFANGMEYTSTSVYALHRQQTDTILTLQKMGTV